MGFFGGGGAAGVGGATGSTDNAILRADGTGGATLQGSALVVEDAVVAFSFSGVAATDIFTAVGHNFTNNQAVRLLSVSSNAGGQLFVGNNYWVRNPSGNDFQLSNSSGGGAINFTVDVTGTIVAVQESVIISNQSPDTNSSIILTPKGNGALILGPRPDSSSTGGDRRGNLAVDLQITRVNSNQVAFGQESFVAGGARNRALGSQSFVSGFANTSSGIYSAGLGEGNTSSGVASFCVNRQGTASGDDSVAFGQRAVANRNLTIAHAGGRFSADGDAQRIFAVLRCKTTTNSAVEMALDGGSTYLTIPSGKVMFCNIKVVGVKSDGATVATYERQYAAKNVAGTSSEVFAPVTIGTDLASGTSLEVATVDAGDYIRIRPTGVASETWRWVASVDAVEVAYGT